MNKNFGNTTKEITRTVGMFMHGLCHLPAIQLNKKYNLPLIIVMDIDDGMNVLVHVANILDDNRIIDMENIYDNEEEFMDFIEEEFEELTEFTIKKEKKPNKLLIEIYNDCPENVIQRNQLAQQVLKEYVRQVPKLLKKAGNKTMQKEEAFKEIIERNKEFYVNHKEVIDRIFHKNNDEVCRLFFQSANSDFYKEIGSYMLYLPVNHKEVTAVIFSHYFCYIIENNDIRQIYKYRANTLTESNNRILTIIHSFKLPKQFRELVLVMSMRFKLVSLNSNLIRKEIIRRLDWERNNR